MPKATKKTKTTYSLREDGVVVYPVFTPEETAALVEKLAAELTSAPEFAKASVDLSKHPMVGGGFAALGNPSSFHSPTVVATREALYAATVKQLSKFKNPDDDRKVEVLIDRVLYRNPGASVGGEQLHRDKSDGEPTDTVFGGWVSLESTQYFHFVPKTHRLDQTMPGCSSGFVKLSTGFCKLSAGEKAYYKPSMVKIEVPVGHAIIFFQNIVHSVAGGKAKTRIMRQFHGYRLTHDDKSIVPGLEAIIAAQGVVPLKSAQVPPMIPKLWNVNWQMKRDTFYQGIYGTKTPWDYINKDTRVHFSLTKCSLPLWPSYDTSIYHPH